MQVGTEQAATHLKTLGMSTMVSAFLAVCILYVHSYAACYLLLPATCMLRLQSSTTSSTAAVLKTLKWHQPGADIHLTHFAAQGVHLGPACRPKSSYLIAGSLLFSSPD